jgi:hypothetical protein
MAAVSAFAGGVVFEEFNMMTALGAFYVKNCAFLPVLCILSRAFHGSGPFKIFLMAGAG